MLISILMHAAYNTILEAVVSWEPLGGIAFLFLSFIGVYCVCFYVGVLCLGHKNSFPVYS